MTASAGPVATPAGMSATADSILKDFLSFKDDIPRPLDGYLLAFDRDITILLHGDRRRVGLQHDLIARRNHDLLAYLQRLVIPHAGRAILADRRRLVLESHGGPIALAAAASPPYAQEVTTKDRLLGSWKVLSLKATTGNKITYPLGEQVAGYVSITSTRIWLLFVDGTRKAPATPSLTDAEAIAMMKTQVAWTGKYTMAEQTTEGIKLTAHVDAASSQAIFDTDRVYFFRIEGNKLVVKSPGVIIPMTGQTTIVEFELVKAD
jgi:Lipocalin-like domain